MLIREIQKIRRRQTTRTTKILALPERTG